jgi:hypothetical protein
MGVIEENVMNVVLEDGGFVDSWEVAACKHVEE